MSGCLNDNSVTGAARTTSLVRYGQVYETVMGWAYTPEWQKQTISDWAYDDGEMYQVQQESLLWSAIARTIVLPPDLRQRHHLRNVADIPEGHRWSLDAKMTDNMHSGKPCGMFQVQWEYSVWSTDNILLSDTMLASRYDMLFASYKFHLTWYKWWLFYSDRSLAAAFNCARFSFILARALFLQIGRCASE